MVLGIDVIIVGIIVTIAVVLLVFTFTLWLKERKYYHEKFEELKKGTKSLENSAFD